VWENMIRRCTNLRCKLFAAYGGRGIVVSERWRDFRNFLADMGERPHGTTLDRIDNARGYEPGNCRWITLAAQQRNRTNNHKLTIDGQSRTLTEWAERSGVGEGTIRYRLSRGWSAGQAVNTPLSAQHQAAGKQRAITALARVVDGGSPSPKTYRAADEAGLAAFLAVAAQEETK
jgi:hypothetical protein